MTSEAKADERVAFEAEEERFFSEPPAAHEGEAEPSTRAAPVIVERAPTSGTAPPVTTALETDQALDEYEAPVSFVPSARQRELRRRVAVSIGGMLALLLGGFVVRKGVEAAQVSHAAARPVAIQAPKESAAPVSVPKAASAAPILAPVPEVPTPPAASVAEATSASPTEVDLTALVRSARSLLNTGHTREGVAAARQAVERNPLDAEPYILLAAGLQDLGAWNEARNVFADCLRKTKHGSSSTCQYFARR